MPSFHQYCHLDLPANNITALISLFFLIRILIAITRMTNSANEIISNSHTPQTHHLYRLTEILIICHRRQQPISPLIPSHKCLAKSRFTPKSFRYPCMDGKPVVMIQITDGASQVHGCMWESELDDAACNVVVWWPVFLEENKVRFFCYFLA